MHEPTTTNTPAAVAAPAPIGKLFKPPQPPLYVPPGHVVFRLLCHGSRVGGVIGKSGSIIKHLQQLTNSRIRVEDPIESCDHRVISVVALPAVANRIRISASSAKAEGESNNDGNIVADDEWFEVSAAQEGVVRVFERVVEVAAEGEGESEGDAVSAIGFGGIVSCRLLALKHQAGAVIGKGGKVVEKIRKDTGSRVKVLPSEKYLSHSSPTDEIVEIEGDLVAVKRALVSITARLQDFAPLEKSRIYRTRSPVAESLPFTSAELPPQQSHLLQSVPSNSISHGSGGSLYSLELEKVSNVDCRTPQLEVLFKILCPKERVGSIIGKGGSIVKALENETGASITVGPVLEDCDDRLITIAAIESVESQISPAQKAAVLVFTRSTVVSLVKGLDSSDSNISPVYARVAVSSNQVGCLLGKGGAVISEMRKTTGAGLRIVGGNQVPKCASENDEVLQITGEFANVQAALYKVTGRLRENFFTMRTHLGSRNCISSRVENGSYNRASNVPPPGPHMSQGISENVNEHESLTRNMDHLGISNHMEQPHSPSLMTSLRVSEVNQENIMDSSQRLHLVNGGVELPINGSRPVLGTNTTVEIGVSHNAIGSIYGENGSNLARLREISKATVTVHESHPETAQRTVVISGTPDQIQVAQSLLQAFMLSGS